MVDGRTMIKVGGIYTADLSQIFIPLKIDKYIVTFLKFYNYKKTLNNQEINKYINELRKYNICTISITYFQIVSDGYLGKVEEEAFKQIIKNIQI